MEENKQVLNDTRTAVPIRKGTVLTSCGIPPVSVATKQYQEHSHGTNTRENTHTSGRIVLGSSSVAMVGVAMVEGAMVGVWLELQGLSLQWADLFPILYYLDHITRWDPYNLRDLL